jgi:hypothetical protein
MTTQTSLCLSCGAPAVQPPYPQLCRTCKAHGISWALRRISAECDALSQQWGNAVATLNESEQARFTKVLEAWSDLSLPGSYRAKQIESTAFWKRIAATIARGDAFGEAVAMWKRHQDRDADRLALRIQQAWLEKDGQQEMDV